jgi:hypothetical protein
MQLYIFMDALEIVNGKINWFWGEQIHHLGKEVPNIYKQRYATLNELIYFWEPFELIIKEEGIQLLCTL